MLPLRYLLIVSFLFCFVFVSAQEVPFSKGINLTNWFQVPSASQIQFTKYTKKDFEQIKSLGCDVIRLPINLHYMTDGSPNYTLDPLFYSFLDQVIDWAEELEMHLILDNHTFDPSESTDPNIGSILEKVWMQMAQHHRDRSEFVYYEILNEPHGISDQQWNTIQQNVVRAIRTVDTKHTIVIGPASWNSYHNLAAMPVYEDDHLIYTFHFYDPFLFTHQGASWVTPSMVPLKDVPFPYASNEMPAFPSSLRGSWIESSYNDYGNSGTVARVKQLIDIAAQFSQTRNVPVFCGEFGVYIPNSDQEDRVFWYETVRNYLEEKQIPWTMWDYHGGFGLFESGGNDLFEHDLNVDLIQALGLTVPEQTPFIPMPEQQGFHIYSDYIGENIVESSYNEGIINFYSDDDPSRGEHCIYWNGANQYNHIGFDFKPDKDFSVLVNNGYALNLMLRGDTPGTSFDIRFLDTKTSDQDHPWRIRVTLDDSDVSWDNQWHRLHIPLQQFTEAGSWDNGSWYNPQGKFDWSAVDRFEIVAEHQSLEGPKFWFDEIQITDQATPTSTTAIEAPLVLDVFPNPANDNLSVVSSTPQPLHYTLLNALGQPLRQSWFTGRVNIDLAAWPRGYYFLKVTDGRDQMEVRKILKY